MPEPFQPNQDLVNSLRGHEKYFGAFPLEKFQFFFPDYKPTATELAATNAEGSKGAVNIKINTGIELEWALDCSQRLTEAEKAKGAAKVAEFDRMLAGDLSPDQRDLITAQRNDIKNFTAKDHLMWSLHEHQNVKGAIEPRFGAIGKNYGWLDGDVTPEVQTKVGTPSETLGTAYRTLNAMDDLIKASDHRANYDTNVSSDGQGAPHIHLSFEHNGKTLCAEPDAATGQYKPTKFYLAALSGTVEMSRKYPAEFNAELFRGDPITVGTSRETNAIRLEAVGTENLHAELRQCRVETLSRDVAGFIGSARLGINNVAAGADHPILHTTLDNEGRITVPRHSDLDFVEIAKGEGRYHEDPEFREQLAREKAERAIKMASDPDAETIYGKEYIRQRAEPHVEAVHEKIEGKTAEKKQIT